jgi:hypothetical protein
MPRMKLAAPFSTEQTIIGHGLYLIAMALLLFLAPAALRLVFAFPAEFDWWNRILALPVFNLGLFCIGGGFLKSRMLIKLTIAMRTLVMIAVGGLVALHIAPPLALGIGGLSGADGLGDCNGDAEPDDVTLKRLSVPTIRATQAVRLRRAPRAWPT